MVCACYSSDILLPPFSSPPPSLLPSLPFCSIDTIHYMVEAAKVLKMVNPKEAVEMYKMCARYQMEDNKYAVAAKNWDEIAQLTGKDLADKKQSIEAYLKSAECYKSENSKVSAQSQLIKAADIMAEEGEYKRAISIYEDVAEEQSGSSAISFSVKNHLFKALLCQFGLDAQNNDVTDTEIKLSKYKEDNPRFAGTKEEELIGNVRHLTSSHARTCMFMHA